MSALTLTLKSPPPQQRLNLALVTPPKLKGMSEREIAAIQVGMTRMPVTLGDAFSIALGEVERIRILGATDKLDHIGWALSAGSITVDGSAGAYAGCYASGGAITITGGAGPYAGAGLSGARIEIGGDAGESAGGALPGAAMGMRGGLLIVRGKTGARTGERMRRGVIVAEGKAGAYLGARMVAGTIAALQGADAYPGYLMNRGAIILDGHAGELSPGFVDCGRQELTILRLLAKQLAPFSAKLAARLVQPVRRFAGDMAALGKGELLRIEG
jgi:formylmethanofuran dehydrogenase subunit C